MHGRSDAIEFKYTDLIENLTIKNSKNWLVACYKKEVEQFRRTTEMQP